MQMTGLLRQLVSRNDIMFAVFVIAGEVKQSPSSECCKLLTGI